jgi:hypothetical protein
MATFSLNEEQQLIPAALVISTSKLGKIAPGKMINVKAGKRGSHCQSQATLRDCGANCLARYAGYDGYTGTKSPLPLGEG